MRPRREFIATEQHVLHKPRDGRSGMGRMTADHVQPVGQSLQVHRSTGSRMDSDFRKLHACCSIIPEWTLNQALSGQGRTRNRSPEPIVSNHATAKIARHGEDRRSIDVGTDKSVCFEPQTGCGASRGNHRSCWPAAAKRAGPIVATTSFLGYRQKAKTGGQTAARRFPGDRI